MTRRALPIIEIPDPCDVPSSEMVKLDEEGRVLACHQCRHNVYDLSKMTTDDAFALLERHEGRLCVQFYARADGTVQTIDCQPSRFEALKTQATRITLTASALLTGFLALFIGLTQVRAQLRSGDEFANVVEKRPKPVHKPKQQVMTQTTTTETRTPRRLRGMRRVAPRIESRGL